MPWTTDFPTPRPLRPAPARNTDAPSINKPATDNPDLASPRPGLGDTPVPGSDTEPSKPTEG
ncbi:MAG TPA: hypothetical protein VD978_25060 [Azospirillum sp.]|nr:hypothetical protein [Azospirillum sp.]